MTTSPETEEDVGDPPSRVCKIENETRFDESLNNTWEERKRSSVDGSLLINGASLHNPFKHTPHPMPIYELIWRIFLTIFLLPIRVLGIFVCIAMLCWPMAVFTCFGQDMRRPFTGWRRFMVTGVAKRLIRAAYFFTGLLWIRVKGKLVDEKEAPILVVAPHTTFFDPVLAGIAANLPSIVAKNDIIDIPIIGRILAAGQPVWIDRFNPRARQAVVEEIKQRAYSNGKWWHLALFPEGTTSAGQSLITFKAGAFLPGVPIQPVSLTVPHYMIWTWDGPSAQKILWMVLTTLWVDTTVEFLPVYVPSEAEKADASLFADNVRKYMADRTGRGVTDIGFEDCRLINAAKAQGLPTEVGTIGVAGISKTMSVNTEIILNELKHYATEGRKLSHGRISLTSFADLIQVPMNDVDSAEIAVEAFHAFDKNDEGVLCFRDYLIFSLMTKKLEVNVDVFAIAELFGPDMEPYSYEVLKAVAKVVLWRRGVEISKIDAAVDRFCDYLDDWKRHLISDDSLTTSCKDDLEIGVLLESSLLPETIF